MIPSIIIAKGYSRRLPKKNIKPFCGHPLFAWTVIQSVNSHLIDQTYVSTDNSKIAQYAESYGAEVIWRYETDDDAVGSVPTAEAIQEIRKEYEFDTFATLLPTAPLRKPDDLDRTIRAYNADPGVHMCIAVVQKEMTVHRLTGLNKGPVYIDDKDSNYAIPTYGGGVCDTDWYLGMMGKYPKTDTEVNGNLMENKQEYWRYIPGEQWQLYDIDYQEDFDLLQILMEYYILKGRGREVYDEYGNGQ
jgi:CMP-N-acetylneuraminic acid synthetase